MQLGISKRVNWTILNSIHICAISKFGWSAAITIESTHRKHLRCSIPRPPEVRQDGHGFHHLGTARVPVEIPVHFLQGNVPQRANDAAHFAIEINELRCNQRMSQTHGIPSGVSRTLIGTHHHISSKSPAHLKRNRYWCFISLPTDFRVTEMKSW